VYVQEKLVWVRGPMRVHILHFELSQEKGMLGETI